ncbi:hypothetical protein JCM19240_5537 [Vibrio maritimus]|uniref:Uncharacterized protein n=1 Tax=Vibrio maritimus TaxID=990268 RepID=A0A090SWQ0_9VIBR|nr:hypothetical protein JCM19240_5537 [Vibrio maritimus]
MSDERSVSGGKRCGYAAGKCKFLWKCNGYFDDEQHRS